MRLRTRLTVFTTLFLAVVLIATALAVYAFTERSLLNSIEERLEESLEKILDQNYGNSSLNSIPSDSYFLVKIFVYPTEKPSEIRDKGSSFRSGEYPFDKSNKNNIKSIYHFNPSEDDLFEVLSDIDTATLFNQGVLNTRLFDSSGRAYIASIRQGVIEDSQLEFFAYTLVASPVPQETLNRLRFLLFTTILIAFVAFAFGVYLLAARVLTPVRTMTLAAAQISVQDLSQRVPVSKSGGELNDLAVTVNSMLERLQESFETQQRFTGYASHELRTPVTVIAGHANYLLRRTKLSGDQVDSLTVIRKEADRMAKLVNDLLELARADAGLNIKREPMNLVEVVEDVKNEIAPVATNVEIDLSISEPLIEILGDANRLKQVILNLLQNALNAGSQQVTMSLQKEGKNVRLEIFDDGSGIPEDSIPHLFERFYRVDGARTKRGSGLGLSIVKWIVLQHEGSVSVDSKIGEGTVFTIMLPILNPKLTKQSISQTLWGKQTNEK